MIAIRNSSRLRVFKISASARGTTVRATTSTPITTSTAFPSASRRPLGPPAARPARKGSTSIMGTTHRSWKISTPVASRPCGASISPLSVSPFKTSAVLDRATRKPSSKAICQEVPDALRSEEHTSELQSQSNLVCRLLLEKKKRQQHNTQCYIVEDATV